MDTSEKIVCVMPGKKIWVERTYHLFRAQKLSNFALALCNCVYEDESVRTNWMPCYLPASVV